MLVSKFSYFQVSSAEGRNSHPRLRMLYHNASENHSPHRSVRRTVTYVFPFTMSSHISAFQLPSRHLECENLVLQLADWLSFVESQALRCFLHGADHRWGTAKEQFNIVSRLGEPFLLLVSTKTTVKYHIEHSQ